MKAEEFIREVDEELQRERLETLWRQYGHYIVAVAVAILLAVASWNGYQWWMERQRLAEARAWDDALHQAEQGQPEAAATALENFAANATGGFATVARLNAAAADIEADKQSQAATVLATAAESASTEPLLKNLAILLEASARLDDADPNTIIEQVRPLAADDSPWQLTAKEVLAAALVRAGQTTEARGLLQELSANPQAPQSMQRRAGALASALGEPMEGG